MTPLEAVVETPVSAIADDGGGIDCIIIGSGTAGVTTAVALAEKGIRSLILEAGPFLLPQHLGNFRIGQRHALGPELNEAVRYGSRWAVTRGNGKGGEEEHRNAAWAAVGGRSLFWSGCAPRYQEWDFVGWPFCLADMEPFYEQAEKLIALSGSPGGSPAYFGTEGQDWALARMKEAGFQGRAAPLGVASRPTHKQFNAGFDSAVARLMACEHFGRLEQRARIALTAQVEVMRLEAEGSRVTRLHLHDRRSGARIAVSAPHVVLAAGAPQSAWLALRSGLDELHPLVGRFISDHLFVQAVAEVAPGMPAGALSVLAEATVDCPYQLQLQGRFRESWYHQSNSTLWVESGDEGAHLMLAGFGKASVFGRNRLDSAAARRGEADMRQIRVLYERSAEDQRRLLRMQDGMQGLCQALGATILRSQVNPPGGALHEIGGLRMGETVGEGVTDPQGRFWQVENLSVADASVFPAQGAANPYLSITAWSLRHAKALAERLGGSA